MEMTPSQMLAGVGLMLDEIALEVTQHIRHTRDHDLRNSVPGSPDSVKTPATLLTTFTRRPFVAAPLYCMMPYRKHRKRAIHRKPHTGREVPPPQYDTCCARRGPYSSQN